MNKNIMEVTSDSRLYDEEKNFHKPYLITWMSRSEYQSLRKNKPDFVKVQNGEQNGESFIRRVIAIHQLEEKGDQYMVGITMDTVIVEIET